MENEPRRNSPKWPIYLAVSCGGCALLVVLAFLGFGYFTMRAFNSAFGEMWKAPPGPPRTGPYSFGYDSSASKVRVQLPDGAGTLVYMHVLPGSGSLTFGPRSLQMIFAAGNTEQWPLPYCQLRSVRVGVYWHHAKGGKGPLVRFYDATGESVLDLNRLKVGQLVRVKGRAFMADYRYNDSTFASDWVATYDANGNVTGVKVNGKPAPEITPLVSSANTVYLGSITQAGNKLVFVPNKPGSGQKKPHLPVPNSGMLRS